MTQHRRRKALAITLVLTCLAWPGLSVGQGGQDEQAAAKQFLFAYAKGDASVLAVLPSDTDENKLAKAQLTYLKTYPFPLISIKTLGYSSADHVVSVQVEMAEIGLVAGAVANMMSWQKLGLARTEVIRSSLIVDREGGKLVVHAKDLVLMMGTSAYYAWWQRESKQPIRLKRFPALQAYVLYAKARGLNKRDMKGGLMEVQDGWRSLGWSDLLKTQ
jgi:hypothetical protein